MKKPNEDKTLGIQTVQVLARYQQEQVQIFFQETRDPVTGQRLKKKEPVTLFIDHAGILNEYPLSCISCLLIKLTEEPKLTFICDSKVRLELGFQAFLVVSYEELPGFELITLPQDLGINVTSLYDLTEKQVSNSAVQTMQWVGNKLVYTLTVPFTDFEGVIPPGLIGSDALVASVSMRNMSWLYELGGVSYDGIGSPPVLATRVDLAVFEDIILRIGVEQGILVNGRVE